MNALASAAGPDPRQRAQAWLAQACGAPGGHRALGAPLRRRHPGERGPRRRDRGRDARRPPRMGPAHRRSLGRRREPHAPRGVRDPARRARCRRARPGAAPVLRGRPRPGLLRDAARSRRDGRPPPVEGRRASCPTAPRSRASWARTSRGCTRVKPPARLPRLPGRAAAPTTPARAIAGYRHDLDALGAVRGEAWPALEWGLAWCARHAPAPLPACLLHRDYRTGNYLVHEGRLAGDPRLGIRRLGRSARGPRLDARPLLALRAARPRGRRHRAGGRLPRGLRRRRRPRDDAGRRRSTGR